MKISLKSSTSMVSKKNLTAIRRAKMNLELQRQEYGIQKSITYYEGPYELLRKADFVMANMPFDVGEIDAVRDKSASHLPFSPPGVNKKGKVSNGNSVWTSYFNSFPNEEVWAGFVMTSQASSAELDEAKVVQKLLENGDVDALAAIPPNFLYTRTVPYERWILNRPNPETYGDKVLMPKSIRIGRFDEGGIALSQEGILNKLSRHFRKARSVVIPRRGEISESASIDVEQTVFLSGVGSINGCNKIDLSEEKLRPKFLSSLVRTCRSFKWLVGNTFDPAMLSLTTKILVGPKIVLPAPTNQDIITESFSVYEGLVKNKRRRIQLLEQALKLLYKEYFVEHRFQGYEYTQVIGGVPEGWVKSSLKSIVPLTFGKALKQDVRDRGSSHLYGSSGVVGAHAKALVAGPTILVGRKGNVDSVCWWPSKCDLIDMVSYIGSEDRSLLLCYALQQATCIGTDYVVPGFNREFDHRRSLLVVEQLILRLLQGNVSPLNQQMDFLKSENSSLARSNDQLLPKLMNGEVVT